MTRGELDARSSLRSLSIRPATRFRCFADGICCTDMHRLGPLEPGDVERLRALGAGAAIQDRGEGELDLRTTAEGHCVLLDGTRCSLHIAGGAQAKPSLCRTFPLSLVATPLGARVVMAHRCPCRTLGDRPELDAESVADAFAGAIGYVREVPVRLRLGSRTTLSFSQWTGVEAPILERLIRGDPAPEALRIVGGLPSLGGRSWRDTAAAFHALGAGVQQGYQALEWFGDGILLALGDEPPPRARPWALGFDRAERRSPAAQAPEAILGDWLAELIWDLSWVNHGPFDHARRTIGALGEIAAAVTRRMVAVGARADRAAAEAVMVAEIGAGSRLWADTAQRVRPEPDRE